MPGVGQRKPPGSLASVHGGKTIASSLSGAIWGISADKIHQSGGTTDLIASTQSSAGIIGVLEACFPNGWRGGA
jgi:hypothetical protein